MAPFHIRRASKGLIHRKIRGEEMTRITFPLPSATERMPFSGSTLAWQFPLSAVAMNRIFVKGSDGEMGKLPQSLA